MKIKQKITAGWLAVAMLFTLSSLALAAETQPPATVTPTQAAAGEAMQAYVSVIQGKLAYRRSGENADSYFKSTVTQWYGYEFNQTFTFDRFCVADPDADGSPELILELMGNGNSPFGYELLRYEAGKVYGFAFVDRAMEILTLQGDIFGSNGAEDNGWYHVAFRADQEERTKICWMENDGSGVRYTVGETEVTKAEYNAYTKQIEARSRPEWLSYSKKNVKEIAAKF